MKTRVKGYDPRRELTQTCAARSTQAPRLPHWSMSAALALLFLSALHTCRAIRALQPRALETTHTRAAVLSGAAATAALLGAPLRNSANDGLPAAPVWSPASQSLAGKTILITGGNNGVGLESAQRLASAGAQLIVTARDQKRANAGAARIQAPLTVIGLELDLASLESVRGLPARLSDALGADVAIDVLINNAQGESPLYSKKVDQGGVAERTTTKDGFDRIIGTAHLSHFALVAALLPALKRSRRAACLRWRLGYTAARGWRSRHFWRRCLLRRAAGLCGAAARHRPKLGSPLRLSNTGRGFRVISVSSESHRSVTRGALFYAFEDGLTLSGPSPPSPFERYSIAKAANVLFTVELQRRIDEAASNTYHRDGTFTHV